MLVGYARCSTEDQDLAAQRARLEDLGVEDDRIYIDQGLTGRNRDRPGLKEALAAARAAAETQREALDAERRKVARRLKTQLDEFERRSALYAFVALANKVAVADRTELSDAESTPIAIDKAADFASVGLEFLSTELGLDAVDVLRRVPLQRLFSVGANLEPERAYSRDKENA